MKNLSLILLSFAAVLHAEIPTVDVPSADIPTALRAVADANNLSLVLPADIPGGVSLSLTGVPWQAAFTEVLSPAGYAWRQEKDLVVVYKLSHVTEVVAISARPAEDVRSAVVPALHPDETATAIGDAVVIEALPERVSALATLVRSLDVRQRQVVVECEFREVATTDSKAVGVDWSALSSLPITIDGLSSSGEPGFSVGELKAKLSLLDASKKSKTLSKPTQRATDRKPASVAIGSQYPLPQYTFNPQSGELQVSGFSYKDIGIILTFTPTVVGDRVLLDLAPEVSAVESTTTFGGQGAATLPVIGTRRLSSRVELKDGEMVVLSGLMTSNGSDNAKSVPGLSKVPGLGRLFKHASKDGFQSELIVLLTVRLVD